MSAARTERLLNLLTLLLNTRRPVSLREIREMDEFAAYCTSDPKSGERAFERDKADLIELGIPLRWIAPELDDDVESSGIGGYIVDRERYYLDTMELDAAELASLSIAGAAAVAMPHFPGRTAVIRALAKIGFDVDESGPPSTLAHTPLTAGHDPQKVGAWLEVLHDAVARRRVVRLAYQNPSGVRSEREVEPWGLYYRQGIWYLVGYCRLRQDERTFHVGRIESVVFANRKAGQPEFEIPEGFALSEHAARRPWEFPTNPPERVVIVLAARLVPAIGELFGPRAQVEKLADGGARVLIDVTHREGLVTAVLPLGAAAQVVEPSDLRRHIGTIFEELARRYDVPRDEGRGGA